MRSNGYGYGYDPYQRRKNNKRLILTVVFGFIVLAVIIGIVGAVSDSKPAVLSTSNGKGTAAAAGTSTVPWDYKVEEAKVGDLIGADMTIQPGNQLLANDDNYGTGDKIWVLSYMTADMKTQADGQNQVTLSSWAPLKSYRTAEAAQKDLEGLKVQVETDVDLVGVYKTEYQGKFRQFAIMSLPTGHTIKQPIAEDRYKSIKDKKQVKVVLEEVHDFGDYDLAMSKFRGWAD
ncbi:signal peptide protein [Gorillibacterium sp. sgz5001074]|uniref:signal peptide protein n=1 Tax=Gorillibacterium sp. sgz5001074 TaxID=3446695 RepID=UPI003F67B096